MCINCAIVLETPVEPTQSFRYDIDQPEIGATFSGFKHQPNQGVIQNRSRVVQLEIAVIHIDFQLRAVTSSCLSLEKKRSIARIIILHFFANARFILEITDITMFQEVLNESCEFTGSSIARMWRAHVQNVVRT
ncbi:Hypothetical_protein [Hexamita inflata]|uniref:Hypothetical_protein n=1 Tax=Hexamita inflata TaxID=28002 RepID=A0AA86VJW0_9EUKA|nr:Hypothetical protein HINF_LOCUS56415 [Hexamita inflata]CAI9968773.1 Hypothetical protein HINF_LOCUS56418 [Hexamita inflata]